MDEEYEDNEKDKDENEDEYVGKNLDEFKHDNEDEN